MKIYEKLRTIQQKLNAPKTKHNKFGDYDYRSCEDIFNAVKPLLEETGCVLTVTDEIERVGERYYVKATASLIYEGEKGEEYGMPERVYNVAYAREPEDKKGNDAAQITGACSSYARKYALNGLFLIDDVRDADETNTHGKDEPEPKKTEPKKPEPKAAPVQKTVKDMVEEDLKRKVTKDEVQEIIKGLKEHEVDVAELLALYKKKSLADFTKFQHDHVFGHWAEIVERVKAERAKK